MISRKFSRKTSNFMETQEKIGQQCDKNCKKRVPDTYSDTHKIFIQWLTPLWVYAKIVDFI